MKTIVLTGLAIMAVALPGCSTGQRTGTNPDSSPAALANPTPPPGVPRTTLPPGSVYDTNKQTGIGL